jgi:hypothetical protein
MAGYVGKGIGIGTGAGIITHGLGDGSLAYDAVRAGNSLGTLLDDAKDMLGFGEIEDIYGDARWTRWLNQSRDDLLAEMGGLLPVSQVWFTATGLNEYDMLPYGFLRIDRVGYRNGPGEGPGEDVAWLPLYDRDDANIYRGGPNTTAGFPAIGYRSGISAIGFAQAPDTGTVYVQGPRLPAPLLETSDRTDLPRLFNEVLCIGAALRACRHDIGRSECGLRLPMLADQWRDTVRRLRYVLAKMTPQRVGYVVGDSEWWRVRP